jgi:hypothetical protein
MFWNHVNRTCSLEVLRGYNLLFFLNGDTIYFGMDKALLLPWYHRWPLLVISFEKNSTRRLGTGATVQASILSDCPHPAGQS